MTVRRLSLAALAGVVALALAGTAWCAAGDEDPARLIAAGVALRQQAKDEEALASFNRAYELGHVPEALAQMGLAEEALGRWERAETHVTAALAVDDPWIARHRSALTAALDDIRGHLGDLEVLGGVAGAIIEVNGETVGALPLAKPLRVTAGTVALQVQAPGFLPVARNINVPAGGLARETISLVKDTSSSSPAGVAPLPSVAPSLVEPVPAPSPARGEAASWRRPAAWSSAAGAVVALGVGIVFTQRAYSYADKFNAHCGVDDPNLGGGSCASEHDTSQSAVAPAVIGFSLAGALGAASAYLFWSAHAQAKSDGLASLSCAPQTAGLGLSCGAVF